MKHNRPGRSRPGRFSLRQCRFFSECDCNIRRCFALVTKDDNVARVALISVPCFTKEVTDEDFIDVDSGCRNVDTYNEMVYLGRQFESDTPDDAATMLMHARRAVRLVDIAIDRADGLEEQTDDDDDKQADREMHFVERELKRTRSQLQKVVRALD